VFGIAKLVRADMAAGGPEKRTREAVEKDARYAGFLKSRTAAKVVGPAASRARSGPDDCLPAAVRIGKSTS
jgi:hypothetical protein